MFGRKDSSDLIRAFALHRHAVDALDDRSRHRVDDPLVLVLLGFQVSVGHRTAGMLPGKVLCLKRRTDFLAGVTGVPLVEQRLFGKGKDKQAEIQYSCGFVAGWLPKS